VFLASIIGSWDQNDVMIIYPIVKKEKEKKRLLYPILIIFQNLFGCFLFLSWFAYV